MSNVQTVYFFRSMKDYIYSIIEKQWWIFIIRFNDPRYISPDGTTAYLSTRTSSFDVSKFHLVCSIRADRQRQEAWITRVRSGRGFLVEIFTSSEHQDSQEDKRFSRKAPFISSFVFNPRILLDDNLPPPCPIRWRHEKSATDSSSDRFHFSSLTCLHLLVTYYYRSAREMKLGKMTNYFKFRQKKLSQLLIKLILLFSNGSKNI